MFRMGYQLQLIFKKGSNPPPPLNNVLDGIWWDINFHLSLEGINPPPPLNNTYTYIYIYTLDISTYIYIYIIIYIYILNGISTSTFVSDQIRHPIEWDSPYYTFTNMFKQPFHTVRRANVEHVYFELDPCSSNMEWVCTSGMEHFSWYCWSIEHTPSGVLCNITLW